MTKITALEQKTYQGKPSGFKVTFDDGRSGNMVEKESDKGLRVGDSVIVTEIPYTSKAGVKSTLYGARLTTATAQTPSSAAPAPNPSAPPQPQQGNTLKAQSRAKVPFTAMEKVVDLVIGGKIPWEKVKEYHKELCTVLYDEIESSFGE